MGISNIDIKMLRELSKKHLNIKDKKFNIYDQFRLMLWDDGINNFILIRLTNFHLLRGHSVKHFDVKKSEFDMYIREYNINKILKLLKN